MISVICVTNNTAMMERILHPSIDMQSAKHERILVDNSDGRFKSAAAALNYAASKAIGEYLMFVHQDVELRGKHWLRITEGYLDGLSGDLGIAGIIGMSADGDGSWAQSLRGFMCNCGHEVGKPLAEAEDVQTLDECVLLIPREVFRFHQFDEHRFDAWHLYGADYCLKMQELGFRCCVVPGYVYHRSHATNTKRLAKYQRRLWWKHRHHFKRIHTTCGILTLPRILTIPLALAVYDVYQWVSPPWTATVRHELKGCQSVLDLGCGYQSALRDCPVPYKVGVDIWPPYVEESRKKGLHNTYLVEDIREVDFAAGSFDAVYASEVLEHLVKSDGEKLLGRMMSWAKKKVIITTPNGYFPQPMSDGNSHQAHLSGWTIDELRQYGFRVQGMGGWKSLTGPDTQARYHPEFFGQRMREVSQIVTRYWPRQAFQLLGVREVDG